MPMVFVFEVNLKNRVVILTLHNCLSRILELHGNCSGIVTSSIRCIHPVVKEFNVIIDPGGLP